MIQFILGLFSRQIDMIYVGSTPPTQGALAGLINIFKKVPVLYILQTVFPDSLVNSGITKKGSPLWRVGRVIEDFTYRNVDKIIVISEDFRQNLLEKGVPDEKLFIIRNWAEEKKVVNLPKPQNYLYDKLELSRDNFYVTYCGTLGLLQNLECLIDVAGDLKKYEKLNFVIMGRGHHQPLLAERIEQMNLTNVHLFPYQHEDLSKIFSLGDVGFISLKKNAGKAGLPSKTWNIMSAERPIIASYDLDSELCSVIQQADCGFCVPPDDKEKLKEAILSLYQDQDRAKEMGQNGRKYLLENLSAEVGIATYVDLVNSFHQQ